MELAALLALRYTGWCECNLPDEGSYFVTWLELAYDYNLELELTTCKNRIIKSLVNWIEDYIKQDVQWFWSVESL